MIQSPDKSRPGVPNSNVSKIVYGRLTGEPVSEISKETGVSRQYIYNVISRLPKDNAEIPARPLFPVKLEYHLVMEYLQRCSREMTEDEQQMLIENISRDYGLDAEPVYKTLCRLTVRHPSIEHYPYYSNIEKWERDHMVSLQNLVESIGTYRAKMRAILRGWEHMPLDLAVRIRDYSGLSITEIYSDLIELDKELSGEET